MSLGSKLDVTCFKIDVNPNKYFGTSVRVTCPWRPVRWSVWTRTWGTIFYCEPEENNLLRVIMDLRWNLIPPHSFTRYTNVVQGAMVALWRSYWSLVFNSHPFVPEQVFRSALKIIHSLEHPPDD
ncbi:hypothetical protein BDC45DRAFT_539011 [Circinella umbellata]|nr:hypothetical protein BDC45DRAFT_539011 [Circinella umbellata]